MRAGFDQAFTDANAGIDVVVRSSDEMGSDGAPPARPHRRLHRRRGRRRRRRARRRPVASRASPRSSAPTATASAATARRPPAPTGSTTPSSTRTASPRAAPPAAPDEVVIDRGAAKNGDLAVGDRTTVLTPEPVEVTVVGIATFGDVDSLGPTTYTAFTLDAARDLFAHRPDAISAVLVAAEDGVSPETLRDEIEQLMPARIEALTQDELTAEQQDDIESDFLGMFEMILLAFAGIALVVATFSIHNTFSILVAQRTRESALLRAIGASRRQVVTAVAVEALVIGVVASAIGFGVGLGLAAGLRP